MIKNFMFGFLFTVASTLSAWAADVEARMQPTALSFTGGASFTNARLEIRGPDDYESEETASRGLPVFRVRGGTMKDGVYFYNLSAATDEKQEIKRKIDNGRGDGARDYTFKPFYMEGMFRITKGLIEEIDENARTDEGNG